MEESRETLTAADLWRIFFRAQDEHGRWISISAKDAPWSPEERAAVCNELWQAGALTILKKDGEP